MCIGNNIFSAPSLWRDLEVSYSATDLNNLKSFQTILCELFLGIVDFERNVSDNISPRSTIPRKVLNMCFSNIFKGLTEPINHYHTCAL